MAVYDCVNFLNENDLYEIRLNQHWDFVDKFIVVEAGETHTGLKKPLKFDHKRFEKYSEKIVYRSFENFDEEMKKFPHLLDIDALYNRGPNAVTMDWTRGHFQANYLVKVLKEENAKSDDIVYISGLDEIVRKEAFYKALKVFEDKTQVFDRNLRPVFGFHFYLYAYKINLLHKHWHDHIAGMITEVGNFDKIYPASIRNRGISTHPHIKDGGWHFTFLDNTEGEMVLEKQRSWSHSRDKYPGRKTKFDHQTLDEALQRFFEDYHVTKVPVIADTHPQYIIDNLDKMQNLIYHKDL